MSDETIQGEAGATSDQGEKKPALKVFKEDVIEALRQVYDPEIPVNIYDLGLIYEVNITETNSVGIVMTLTTPNCPEAQSLPAHVQETVQDMIPGVGHVHVEIVWEPAWTKDKMSEDAKLALGIE